jgi:RNA polymerase sigma-70 factor (ECF subfamily)
MSLSTIGQPKRKSSQLGIFAIAVVERKSQTSMSICKIELPHETNVRVSQQVQDLELIRRSQAGDAEAFGELVTKYRAKIFIMVCGMIGNEHDAWDLAQEGFVKAWRSIHRFEGRSSFYTWFYSITMNLTISSVRRKSRQKEVELNDYIPSSLHGPGVYHQRTEIREQVYAALAKLSPEHRAVIVLKDLEDLHYHEIAEILDVSLGTVMSRLLYGGKKLQSILRPVYNQIYQTRQSSTLCANICRMILLW